MSSRSSTKSWAWKRLLGISFVSDARAVETGEESNTDHSMGVQSFHANHRALFLHASPKRLEEEAAQVYVSDDDG